MASEHLAHPEFASSPFPGTVKVCVHSHCCSLHTRWASAQDLGGCIRLGGFIVRNCRLGWPQEGKAHCKHEHGDTCGGCCFNMFLVSTDPLHSLLFFTSLYPLSAGLQPGVLSMNCLWLVLLRCALSVVIPTTCDHWWEANGLDVDGQEKQLQTQLATSVHFLCVGLWAHRCLCLSLNVHDTYHRNVAIASVLLGLST